MPDATTLTAAKCRKHAEECRTMASDPRNRALAKTLSEIATMWEKLAEHQDRINSITW
jgi:hypothetical protein